MAYVVPNSVVYLLKNVPLDVEHKHTWYFNDYTTQLSHFLTNYFTDQTLAIYDSQYIRYEDGSIKVPFSISKCIDCNYMIFGNASFEQRWFYAFITNVEYVSNDVTKIYYEIDELQTWMCFFTLEQCFVERQHQVTDTAGDNLVPEGLEYGDYVIDWNGMPSQLASHYIVVASTLDSAGQYINGYLMNRVYSGIGFTIFNADSTGVTNANALLASLQSSGNNNAVVGVFMCPQFLFSEPNFFYSYVNKPTTLNGYTPRNQKLLTHPYTFAYVTNMQGLAAKFNFEYFNGTPTFMISGAVACDPQLIVVPCNYKGVVNNYDEAMTVGNFPKCAYNTDSFKAWIAQNVGSIGNAAITLAGEVADIPELGTSYSEGETAWSKAIGKIKEAVNVSNSTYHAPMAGPAGAIPSVANQVNPTNSDTTIFSLLKQVVERYIKPPQSVGGSSASALFAVNNLGFVFAVKSITSQFAQIIDKYFDAYGYAIHRIQTPNIHARKGWTYVRTKNCVVNGQLPASSARFIEKCFDAGVTFWNPTYTMGDYTQDNSVGGV